MTTNEGISQNDTSLDNEFESAEERASKERKCELRFQELSKKRILAPEIEEVIREIDFSRLKILFEEIFSRLPVEPEYKKWLMARMSFATKERVIPVAVSPGKTSFGETHGDAMAITIENHLGTWSKESHGPRVTPLDVFAVIAHEETHLVSESPFNRYNDESGMYSHSTGFEMMVGTSANENSPVLGSLQNRTFNEGVTEIIAYEISQEYLARYGFMGYNADELEKVFFSVYSAEMLFVEAMIEVIADDTGVPWDIVWQAIKTAYFTRDSQALLGDDVQELFMCVTDSKFWGRFATLSNDPEKTSGHSLADELERLANSKKLTPGLAEQIQVEVIRLRKQEQPVV